MSYDAWKTRTPEDEAMRDVPLARRGPQETWRICPLHGWALHRGWPGDVPVCVECGVHALEPVTQ